MGSYAAAFTIDVYRFVHPDYTSVEDMFAGKGPLHAHGRWLRKGSQLATYTSLTPEVALAEALAAGRYYGLPDSKSAPLVFVTARANLHKVLDLREGALRQRLRFSMQTITQSDWREENASGRESKTQAFGYALLSVGLEGFISPSAAYHGGSNLIIFPENLSPKSFFKIHSKVKWPRL